MYGEAVYRRRTTIGTRRSLSFPPSMTEVGIEPTKSPGSRPDRFTRFAYSANKFRVQESHLSCYGYEPRPGTRPRGMTVAEVGFEPTWYGL